MSAVPEDVPEAAPEKIPAVLPLAVLESIRRHDRPREVLEDENLAASLPRRLGLTHVIESQIERYRRAHRRSERVPVADVRDLLRLVLRRPDAEDILRDAGRITAQRNFEQGPGVLAAARRLLPRRAALAAARGAVRRLLRRLAGDDAAEVDGRPFTARVAGGPAAGLDGEGPACAFYGGMIARLISLYTRREESLDHRCCRARGDDRCEWVLAEP